MPMVGEAELLGLQQQLLDVRGATQERVVRRDLQLGIVQTEAPSVGVRMPVSAGAGAGTAAGRRMSTKPHCSRCATKPLGGDAGHHVIGLMDALATGKAQARRRGSPAGRPSSRAAAPSCRRRSCQDDNEADGCREQAGQYGAGGCTQKFGGHRVPPHCRPEFGRVERIENSDRNESLLFDSRCVVDLVTTSVTVAEVVPRREPIWSSSGRSGDGWQGSRRDSRTGRNPAVYRSRVPGS